MTSIIHASRRGLLGAGIAAAATGIVGQEAAAAADPGLTQQITADLLTLPGRRALAIWAPAANGRPELRVGYNSGNALFCGSAFKVFVLAKYLQDIDATAARLNQSLAEDILIDENIWSPGSAVINPPNVKGRFTTRVLCEAMISRSDNTATDAMLRRVGPDRVRALLKQQGLDSARIPDSTMSFFGYILGVPNYKSFDWRRLQALPDDASYVNRPLNNVTTMCSSPNDFVTFYARALQGKLFKNQATLDRFRSILMLADAVPLIAPLGSSFFMKGGSIDANPDHALCVAGGAYMSGRWVYFAITINWVAATEGPGSVADRFGPVCRSILTRVQKALA